MKLKKIEMFRRHENYDWMVFSIHADPASCSMSDEVLIFCHKIWDDVFPHLQRKRKVTLTVHNMAVKGSKMFHISRPQRVMNFYHGIRGITDMFQEMADRINNLLDSQGKEQMLVWVTAK